MMENDIVIDNMTYKIMKYLYGKRKVKYGKIRKKFGDDNAYLVSELCRVKYAAIHNSDGSYTQDTSYLPDDYEVSLLVPGNKYVEDRRSSNMIRITPILLSAVSVLISILGLIISITSSNTEIFVHLLK